MKITLPVLGLSFLVSICISLAWWFWFAFHQFEIPEPQWLMLIMGLRYSFSSPDLRWITFESLALGFGSVGFMLSVVGDWGSNGERVVRGARLVTGAQLAKMTRNNSRRAAAQVEIAGVPIPTSCEPSHFLNTGSTNTGKSTAIDELQGTALARGDRCIVVDPNGHSLSRFWQKGDIVLNPFDRRSPGWSLFNESKKNYDLERLATSVVPQSADAGSQQWHGYAQQLLAETMRCMFREGETGTDRLIYWLNQAPAKDLATFLAGSAASGLFEPGAERALASTRFILNYHIGPYQHLQPGDFSLRTWLESGQGNLYLTWREDMLATVKPLITAWVDILISSVLTLPTDNPRPLWVILDELASLERLTSLEAALTKGRKHGLRVVAGLQSVAQLDSIYGRENAKTLRSCFRNVLALGCSNADPDTAAVIADGLGQNEIERVQTTFNKGPNSSTTSKTVQRSTQSLVLPSQLMNLPPLQGYLKLAGNFPVASIRLQPGAYKAYVPAFVER